MKGVNNDAIGKMSVHLLDDDRYARKSLRRVLSKLGFENITAAVDRREWLSELGPLDVTGTESTPSTWSMPKEFVQE